METGTSSLQRRGRIARLHYLLGRNVAIAVCLAKADLAAQAEYRGNFVLGLTAGVLNVVTQLIFFSVIYGHVPSIAGWSAPELYLLVGTNTLIASLHAAFLGNISGELGELVRLGTLDSILIKPISPRFWVSVRRVNLDSISELALGLGVVAYSVHQLDVQLSASSVVLYIVLVVVAVILRYSFSAIVAMLAFWVTRVDALGAIMMGLLSYSVYPPEFYRRFVRQVFMFLVPVALMASVPARTLEGALQGQSILSLTALAAAVFFASTVVWHAGVRRYQSVGG